MTVNVGNVADDPDYLIALPTTRSEMIVPVIGESQKVIGTLDVESEKAKAFGARTQLKPENCARLLTRFWIDAD